MIEFFKKSFKLVFGVIHIVFLFDGGNIKARYFRYSHINNEKRVVVYQIEMFHISEVFLLGWGGEGGGVYYQSKGPSCVIYFIILEICGTIYVSFGRVNGCHCCIGCIGII